MIYDHQASLERVFGVAEELSRYGGVCVPDLPGFGGMDSFYRIGETPTLDNLADYLAAFIKLRYKRRRVSVLAMSFGFLVVTRMLQRYPELVAKVDLLVSLAGFIHHDDIKISRDKRALLRVASVVFARRIPAWLARNFLFKTPLIRLVGWAVAARHPALRERDKTERAEWVNSMVGPWRLNDTRTHMRALRDMLTVNLCDTPIDLPVYHVAAAGTGHFDNRRVEKRLSVIFTKVNAVPATPAGRAAGAIAGAGAVIPTALRRVLARS